MSIAVLLVYAFASDDAGASAAPAQEEKGKEKAREGAPGDAPDIEALGNDLRQAVAGGLVAKATVAIDQLSATGDLTAYGLIIQHALAGTSYAVEKYAGGVLAAAVDPKVRAKILEDATFQRNPKFKARIILLAVVKRWADDPKALAVLHNALRDPSKPVLLVALQLLGEIKKTESVEPLIDELEAREKRPHDRVYHDIVKTLRFITAVDLEHPADWKNYWTARKAGGAPPPKMKESLTRVYKRPKFFSIDVDTDRVIFVIDVSGSMTERDPEMEAAVTKAQKPGEEEDTSGATVVVKKAAPKAAEKAKQKSAPPASRERIFRVKEELVRVLNSLQPPTRFGILSFSHELRWWGGGKTMKDATPANRMDAVSWVRSLAANGATRTDKALEEVLSLPEVDTIYLLTDGAPKDERDKRLEIEPILAFVKEAGRFLRCRIHTISFAQIRDKRMVTFVKQLAAQNDGVCTMLP